MQCFSATASSDSALPVAGLQDWHTDDYTHSILLVVDSHTDRGKA